LEVSEEIKEFIKGEKQNNTMEEALPIGFVHKTKQHNKWSVTPMGLL